MGTGAEKLEFGNRNRRIDRAPTIGRYIEAGRVTVGLVPPRPYEVNFKAPDDVITMHIARLSVMAGYNSDRLAPHHLSAGEFGWHPAACETKVEEVNEPAEFVYINADPALREEVTAETGALPGWLTDFRIVPLPAGSLELAKAVRRFILSGGPGGKMVAEAFAVQAIAQLIHTPDASPPSHASLSQPMIRRLTEFVDAHLHENFGIEDLAGIAGLSTFHFARLFKRSTGQSPHQFVMERRVARARQQLQFSNDSLADIAYDTGFSSQSHMTDTFRKLLGTTPARYRRDAST